MKRKLAYIDINDASDMDNPTALQQAALSELPKIEKFCSDNGLSWSDLDDLTTMLKEKLVSTPL